MRRAAECLAHLPVFGRPPRLTAARCCRSTGCASSAASSVRPWDRSGSGAIREGRQKRACGFVQRGWHACSRTCGTAKNQRRLLKKFQLRSRSWCCAKPQARAQNFDHVAPDVRAANEHVQVAGKAHAAPMPLEPWQSRDGVGGPPVETYPKMVYMLMNR